MKTYKQGAMALFNKGFEPIPIKTASKFPAVNEWQKRLIDHNQVDTWSNNGLGTCGIGIRLGIVCSIDVDAPNQEISTQMLQHITELNEIEPLYRVGQKPKFCVPFYNTEGLTKQVSKAYSDDHGNKLQLEILATGQQFVAHGIHPGTGNEYQWFNGSLEELFSNQSLPEFDELTLLSLIDFFEELCESKGYKELTNKRPKTPSTTSAVTGDPFIDEQRRPSKAELISKLKSIDPVQYDYDQDGWFTIITSIHWSTYGSKEGLEIAKAWSKQSPLWRDGAPDLEVRWDSLSLNKENCNLITFATICNIATTYSDVTNVTNVTNVAGVTKGGISNTVVTHLEHESSTVSNTVSNIAILPAPAVTLWDVMVEWIGGHPGTFTTQDLYRELGLRDTKTMNVARTYLGRMVKTDKIKMTDKRGTYAVLAAELEKIIPTVTKRVPLPLPLPFGLSKHANIMLGDVVVIGGETNAGKTTTAMELLATWLPIFGELVTSKSDSTYINNLYTTSFSVPESGYQENIGKLKRLAKKGIRYLSSEMDGYEIGDNLANMKKDIARMAQEKVEWVRCSGSYGSSVLKDGVNIIDYLEIHEEFHGIGGIIKDIADNVGEGLVFILIQVKRGEQMPRGADFSIERSRLAISLSDLGGGHKGCHILKCKYPTDNQNNPQGKDQDFIFDPETRMSINVGEMRYLSKKEREKINAKYKQMETDTLFKGDFESDKTPKH